MKFLVKVTIKNTQCSVNIHSFHVHCCSVLFFPGWAWAGRGVQEAWNSLQQSLDTFCLGSMSVQSAIRLHSTITKIHSSSCSVAVCSFTCLFIPVSSRSVPQALLSFYCSLSIVWSRLLSFTLNWCLSPLQISSPAHTNSISVATHPACLFVTTPRACAMKSKLDRPHPLVEYVS